MSPPRRRKTPARANQSRSQSQGRRRQPPVRDFWGHTDHDAADDVDAIRPIDDPAVLVRSLGPPPLPGHETAAGHYFEAVYDKAANLAVALAAASGLLATEEPDDDPSR